jgi:predicted transcriptional regulator
MSKFPDSIKDFINVAALRTYTKTLEAELTVLKALHEHLGLTTGKQKRGTSKASRKTIKRGPRGKVKEAVLAYLHKNQKGKAIEIAKLSGLKVASVHQSLLALKKSGHVSKSKKRGSPFILAKK